MGKIFYIMGKSSSGKDTHYQALLEDFKQLKKVVLYTTRPRRTGEEDGVDYYFINDEHVEKYASQGKIIELRAYNTMHGVWKYMTIDDGNIDLQKENYLVIGTLESYEQIKAYFGEEYMVPLYIEVEDGERLMRALKREQEQPVPKYAEMCRRFLADTEDFSEENLHKAGIVKRFSNIERKCCLKELKEYIRQELEKEKEK